jgi:hypothetical protein
MFIDRRRRLSLSFVIGNVYRDIGGTSILVLYIRAGGEIVGKRKIDRVAVPRLGRLKARSY